MRGFALSSVPPFLPLYPQHLSSLLSLLPGTWPPPGTALPFFSSSSTELWKEVSLPWRSLPVPPLAPRLRGAHSWPPSPHSLAHPLSCWNVMPSFLRGELCTGVRRGSGTLSSPVFLWVLPPCLSQSSAWPPPAPTDGLVSSYHCVRRLSVHHPFISCVDAVGHTGGLSLERLLLAGFQLCAHPAQSPAAHGASTPCPFSSPYRLCSPHPPRLPGTCSQSRGLLTCLTLASRHVTWV